VAPVGAVSGPGVTAQSGAAYAFTREDGVWGKEAKLIASDGADGDFFGKSLALDHGTVIVGAESHTTAAAPRAGSAYVYRRLNGNWSQLAEVSASDGIMANPLRSKAPRCWSAPPARMRTPKATPAERPTFIA